MGRGRPKSTPTNPEDLPRQFERQKMDDEGVVSIWSYDLDVTDKGPVSVEQCYPKDYLSPIEKQNIINSKLPKSKQQFFNPETGKLVSYQRALQLGILDVNYDNKNGWWKETI